VPPAGSLRVVQVNVFVDPATQAPEQLLERWTGLALPAEAAAEAGCAVAVVQAGSGEAALERAGVSYHFTREPPPSRLRRRLGGWAVRVSERVLERVVALRPDVVHLHGLSFPRYAAALQRRLPHAPLVVQDHADRPVRPALRGLHRRGWRGVSGLLITSREQAEPFFDAGIISRSVRVFEVTESTTRFGPGDQADARAATGLHGDPALLWVGRLDGNKDPLAVLEAFAEAARQLPKARLTMCWGAAPLLDAVRARVAADEVLAERVSLLGHRPHEEIELLMRAADALVQGSHREGSGYAVIEALACGATPLVTDLPALRRITRSGAVGTLSPPGDVRAMARAIVDFGGRDRTAARAAARAHFERHLSLAALGAELRAAYEAVTAR
jgi:glycosyltransferase involved in cell wall biosynthesis